MTPADPAAPSALRRRAMLTGLAAAPAAAGLAGAAVAQGAAPPAPPVAARTACQFFNPDELRAVVALADRIIPADDLGPGAIEADVPVFLDRQLAGAWGAGAHFYRSGPHQPGTPEQGYQLALAPADLMREGLARMDAAARAQHGRAFADLAPDQQEAMMEAMHEGKLDMGPVPSNQFFNAVSDLVMEGFFADPLYGGNKDCAGWKLVGFPGSTQLRPGDRAPQPGVAAPARAHRGRPRPCDAAGPARRDLRDAMSAGMPAVDAVIVGGGWTGSIIGKELAAAGQRVVMLERGEPRWTTPDYQVPQVHDELKYQRRGHTHQDAAKETYTFRNTAGQVALPMRRFQFAFPGSHLGGSGAHWSGAYYRYDENEFRMRSHYTERYGKGSSPTT